MIGVDPGPYSLRELLWMAEGSFAHTSRLEAWLYNVHRGKQPMRPPEHFNPFARRRAAQGGRRLTAQNIGLLAQVFLGPGGAQLAGLAPPPEAP